jgi:proprotein convertase subtilisin/kexin type 5
MFALHTKLHSLFSTGDCTECSPGYYHDPQTLKCSLTCPQAKYAESKTMECIPCHSRCSLCSGPAESDCISCSPEYYLSQSNKCVPNCDISYYPSKEGVLININVCKHCMEGCWVCVDKYSCLLPAPGYFIDQSLRVSKICHPSCVNCVGPTSAHCSSCPEGLWLSR